MRNISYLKQNGVNVDKSLEIFGDIETYNETIGEFLISIEDKLAKLASYKDAKDMANYAIYVHSLKSDARNFGFEQLQQIAYDHEMKSKSNDFYYIMENFDKLTEAVLKTENIVKNYMSDITTLGSEKVLPADDIYDTKTILVADDSNIIRNFVKRIFSDDYAVGIAKDGAEAIDVISKNKDNGNIVAILLDLNMPKVDGFKVLDYMQENNLFDTIPVSIISGDSSKETIDRAFLYKIVDMLGKPFNNSDVKRVVEKTILYQEMK